MLWRSYCLTGRDGHGPGHTGNGGSGLEISQDSLTTFKILKNTRTGGEGGPANAPEALAPLKECNILDTLHPCTGFIVQGCNLI